MKQFYIYDKTNELYTIVEKGETESLCRKALLKDNVIVFSPGRCVLPNDELKEVA